VTGQINALEHVLIALPVHMIYRTHVFLYLYMFWLSITLIYKAIQTWTLVSLLCCSYGAY